MKGLGGGGLGAKGLPDPNGLGPGGGGLGLGLNLLPLFLNPSGGPLGLPADGFLNPLAGTELGPLDKVAELNPEGMTEATSF